MDRIQKYWQQVMAIFCFTLIAACATQDRQQARYENPPPASSNPSAYQVDFETNSYDINSAGKRTIEYVADRVRGDDSATVTVVGRTDTTGNAALTRYVMRSSRQER